MNADGVLKNRYVIHIYCANVSYVALNDQVYVNERMKIISLVKRKI